MPIATVTSTPMSTSTPRPTLVDDPIADDDNALTDEDDAAAIDADEDELPRTASPLPLIALLGAGSLISALGFRVTRK